MADSNKLEYLAEFREVLEQYRPSDRTIQTLRDTPLVLMVGPTAAGRNTLINLLLQTGRYHYLVSDTTRKPRENNGVMEQEGVEYWFKSEEEFLTGLKDGVYLEAAIIHNQQVSGMSIRELDSAKSAGLIAINEVQPDGARNVHAYSPEKLIVFLLPPTFDIWMERLRARGHMPEDEVRRRLESAVAEITEALHQDYYHFVINNEIHEAAVAVDELANGRIPDKEKQRRGRDHAEQLALDVQLYIRK